jgi:small-conductance mechanosensitive channel
MFLLSQVDLSHAVTATQDLDLNQLAHLSGGNPMMLLALGAVAILGGKKGWDWLKQRQEQQHEQKMAEIEAQKTSASSGHEQCVAKQQTLETQVSGLKGKIVEIENKAVAIEKSAEETKKQHEEALNELEESVKKTKKKVKKLEDMVEESEKKKGK